MRGFRLATVLIALFAGAAHAQVNPGTSPLSGKKGGTNNAFMQFSGPASSLKTYTLPNASDILAALGQIQTWTGAQSFSDGKLVLLGSSSGSSTIKAPATGGGTATLFAGSDTIAGLAATQTLTNKTFNCANNTCTVRLGSDVTGQLPIANGGTGQATQQAALNALAPTPTRAGDVMYYNGTNWVAFAGNNSGTQFFTENASGVPAWATVSGTGTVTSVTCGTGLSGGTFTTSGTCAVNYAAKADQQAGTSTILEVNPSIQQQHDSAAKAWISFTGSTGAFIVGYNTSCAAGNCRSGAGAYTVTFTTAFAAANYACHVTSTGTSGGIIGVVASKSTGSVNVDILSTSGTGTDPTGAVDVVCYGRQ